MTMLSKALCSTMKEKPQKRSRTKELAGHPMARGCHNCAALATRCPLLDQSKLTWPCDFCLKDDEQCQLIREPIERLACESCKAAKMKCSFATTSDYKGPCHQCKHTCSRCIAGPTKAAAATKVCLTYDRDYQANPLTKAPKFREIRSCKRCQAADRDRSFDMEHHDGLCTACEMEETPCERERATAVADGSQGTGHKRKRKGKSKGKKKRRRREMEESEDQQNDTEGKPRLGGGVEKGGGKRRCALMKRKRGERGGQVCLEPVQMLHHGLADKTHSLTHSVIPTEPKLTTILKPLTQNSPRLSSK